MTARTFSSPDEQLRFQQLRWTSVSLLTVAFMVAFFHRMAPAVIADELQAAFQTSAAALGSLAAIYYYVYTAMQIPAGVLADTLGPRRNVALFSVIAGLGSILFALATELWMANAGRFLIGLGVSTAFIGVMKLNANWFSERRYAAVGGFVVLLGNLGSVLSTLPLSLLLAATTWRAVFAGMGIFSLLLAVAIWGFVRDTPAQAGFPSPRVLGDIEPVTQYSQHWWRSLREVLGTRALWPAVLFFFGMLGNGLAFNGLWGVPLIQDRFGLSRAEASTYLMAGLLCFAFSSFASGWLSDALGRRKPVLVVSAVTSCLSWLAMILLPWGPGWSGYLLFAVMGLSTAAVVPAYAAAKELARPSASGMAIAMVNTALFLGAAVLQPLFGWIMDLTWDGSMADGLRLYAWPDYRNALWMSLGVALLGMAGALAMRETHNRNVTMRDNALP